MTLPLPVSQLIEEWILWASWQAAPENNGATNDELIGFGEFEWTVREHPEHAWKSILATLFDSRVKPYLAILAAGPLEDLLSQHGTVFIERVEREAQLNSEFASLLGGVWQFEMSEEIWARVQAISDRRGWDGIPND